MQNNWEGGSANPQAYNQFSNSWKIPLHVLPNATRVHWWKKQNKQKTGLRLESNKQPLGYKPIALPLVGSSTLLTFVLDKAMEGDGTITDHTVTLT